MRKVVTGNTLDEAVMNAMIELSVPSDKIAYVVLQEGKKGFLGIGSKPFKIEAYNKDDKEEVYKEKSVNKRERLVENSNGVYEFKSKNIKYNVSDETKAVDVEEAYKIAEEFLMPILNKFKIPIKLIYNYDVFSNILNINIKGDKMGIIIGKKGSTLNALQHLTNICVNSKIKNKVRVCLDIEDYREKRNQTLEALAKNVANNVRKTKKEYAFEPMSSYERKIIHSVLQKEKNIETVSVGKERDRHVVVKFKRY